MIVNLIIFLAICAALFAMFRAGFVANFLANIEALLAWIGSFLLNSDLPSYCQIETGVPLNYDDAWVKEKIAQDPEGAKPFILVTRECSMLTVFELTGSMDIVGEKEFAKITQDLSRAMASHFQRAGHGIEFSFERDPAQIMAEIKKQMEPSYQTAARIGLEVTDVLDDRCARIASLCSHENALVVVYTHMSALSKHQSERELKDHRQRIKDNDVWPMPYAQSPTAIRSGLLHTHETFVQSIEDEFKLARLHVNRLSIHEASNVIKRSFDRGATSPQWKAAFPGDHFWPRAAARKGDLSNLFLPRVADQLNTTRAVVVDEFVKIGGFFHASAFMELGPQDLKQFDALFSRVGRDIPWRIKFAIEPGGLEGSSFKKLLVSIIGFMSQSNGAIKRSFDAIEAARAAGETDVTVKICASTWARTEEECRRNRNSLVIAMQSWGTCQIATDAGDPVAGLASTIPAYSDRNISPKLIPTMSEIVKMLPITRPASPWSNGGSIPLRTLDGKLYPYQPNSSLQTAWIDLIWAIMGSGKSLWLNTLNFGAILSPGLKKLLLTTIIDVGPSSKCLVELLQGALPAHRKHEAMYVRLRNSTDFAINPCDVDLGCRYPNAMGRAFLVQLLCLLATPVGDTKPFAGAAEISGMMVDLVYEKYATKGQEKTYEPTIDPKVDAALAELGIETNEKTSWYDVCDRLAVRERYHEARLAHRFAVPVLSDFVGILQHNRIKSVFAPSDDSKLMTDMGMTLIDAMGYVLTNALRDYEVISSHTRFEISESCRVLALDLEEVTRGTGEEGKKAASIMFLFAREIAARKYYLNDEVLKHSPDIYHAFHLSRIEDIKDEMKALCIDELHRTGGMAAFRKILALDRREGRKHGIRVSLASQFMEDFDSDGEAITESAFSIYMLNAGTAGQRKKAQEVFGLSESAIDALEKNVRGAGKFLVWHQIKTGVVTQILHNAPSSIELWAFSTTAKDASLRRRLYEKINPVHARRILAKEFPAGTAVPYLDSRQKQMAADDEENVVDVVVNELLVKYHDLANERLAA